MSIDAENLKREDRAAGEATEAPARPAPNLSAEPNTDGTLTIAKPATFALDKFKSRRAATIANVEALPAKLSHYKISNAKDFVRLHPVLAKLLECRALFCDCPDHRTAQR